LESQLLIGEHAKDYGSAYCPGAVVHAHVGSELLAIRAQRDLDLTQSVYAKATLVNL
jgi:hypothetical protein